jgi:hypothetical protein
MTRVCASALAAIFLLGAGQATAATDPAAAPPQATPVSPVTVPAHPSAHDPNEVVCKREDVSGTRLGGTKVCHTRQEWSDMAAQARDTTSHFQQSVGGLGPH